MMTNSEISEKMVRLQAICQEAKEIIASLEAFIMDNSVLSNVPVSSLEISEETCRTRFCNVCSVLGITSIQDLVDYGRVRLSHSRNIGDRTLNLVSSALSSQFGIKW